MSKVFFICALIFNACLSNAQIVPWAVNEENSVIQGICEAVDDSAVWLYIATDYEILVEDFWDTYLEDMGLTEYNEMVLYDTTHDELGYIHYWYKQYYKDIEVEGAMYVLHENEYQELYLAHGRIIENLDLTGDTLVSEEDALTTALNAIDADTFAWEDDEWEQEIRLYKNDSDATFYPTGKLLIAQDTGTYDILDPDYYHTCWVFNIFSLYPYLDLNVYINAENGALCRVDTIQKSSCNPSSGTFNSLYYGTGRAFTTRYNNPNYSLEDCNRNIQVKNDIFRNWMYYPRQFKYLEKISNSSNSWGDNNKESTTALFVTQKIYDYFKTNHNFVGWNWKAENKTFPIQIRTNAYQWSVFESGFRQPLINNAYFIYKKDEFFHIETGTDPSSIYDFVSFDILAHEYTHAIVKCNAKFGKSYKGFNFTEKLAIEESICDIYACLIDQQETGEADDWQMGISNSTTIYFDRDLAYPDNPAAETQMRIRYDNKIWPSHNIDGANYINSGIHSVWFYNLVEGSQDNNAIPVSDASKILMYALTHHSTDNTNFITMRLGELMAASSLYGRCSSNYIETNNAYSTNGFGALITGHCAQIKGYRRGCLQESTTLTAISKDGATFTWGGLPNDWTYTTSGTGNKYLTITDYGNTTSGTINVTATLNGAPQYASHNLTLVSCPDFKQNTSIESKESLKIILKYDNLNNKFHINSDNLYGPFNYYISNSLGQVIDKGIIDNDDYFTPEINKSGIYYLTVSSNQNIETHKFVISR